MPSSGKTVVKLQTRHTAMQHNTMVCMCRGTAASPQRRQVEALFPAGWGRCSRCPVLLGPCLGLVGLFHGKGFHVAFLRVFSLPRYSNQIDGALTAAVTHFRKKSTWVLIITSASFTFFPVGVNILLWQGTGCFLCPGKPVQTDFLPGSSCQKLCSCLSFVSDLVFFLLLVLNGCLGFGD